jgi:hypothetical protein
MGLLFNKNSIDLQFKINGSPGETPVEPLRPDIVRQQQQLGTNKSLVLNEY